ncbi:MAG: hypothetical protein WC858_02435 [Parcubacteria group bacterium]|jgi:hypothetical protein
MRNIIADTIKKIKDERIRPEPRWKYLAKKYSAWLSFFAVALFGAAVSSVVYFLLSQLDWDLSAAMPSFPLSYYLSLIPYLWIVPFIVIVFLAFFALRKTEQGYRYNFLKIIAAALGIILAFGTLTTLAGFGGKINGAMMHDFPGYDRLITTKESQWSQPEIGLLAGTINSVSENSVELQDLSGKDWQILIDEKTVVRPSVRLESGKMIKTIGQAQNNQTFKADEIRPWQGKGPMNGNMGAKSEDGNNPDGPKGMMNGRQK